MKPTVKDRLIFFGPLLVLPGLLVAWPLLEVAGLSFRNRVVLFGIDRWAGLENFAYLLGEDLRFARALGNTLYFTGLSVGLEFVLGLAFALYLRFGRTGFWLKVVLLLPWAIPNVVSARLWQWMFDAESGIVNYALYAMGVIDTPVAWLSTPALAIHSAILADVWKTTPFMALLLYAGLQRVPENLIRAARVDRTPPMRFLFRILLPQLRPVVMTALILRLLDAFRVFDLIYVMTGGGPANGTETLSIYAYRTMFQSLQFGYGSAIAVIQVFVMLVLAGSVVRALKRKRSRA
ncbi:MAG: carbohydrate ABC transporter permease [Nitrospinales bacterium]